MITKYISNAENKKNILNPFPHTAILQQTTLKTLWQKEKLLGLSNFFFCHYVFKKLSDAEASQSAYMRERVK